MANTQSILDMIRKHGGPPFPDSLEMEQSKEEYITFKDLPLLVIMGFTELHSKIDERDYSGVFGDGIVMNSLYNKEMCNCVMGEEFDDLRVRAEAIIEYYTMYVVQLKFRFEDWTPWQENLLEALRQMKEENRLQIKLLPLVAKLPVFYDYSCSLEKFYKDRPEPVKNDKWTTYEETHTCRTLKYIDKIKKPAKRKHNKVSYLFEDEKRFLYEIEMIDEWTVNSAMLKIFEQPVTVQCHLRIKEDIENHASFYCCDAVKFV
jgi:hypothetical protein